MPVIFTLLLAAAFFPAAHSGEAGEENLADAARAALKRSAAFFRSISFVTNFNLLCRYLEMAGADSEKILQSSDWLPLWTRERGAGSSSLDTKVQREGNPSIRVEHRGARDWSLSARERIPVREGDLLEIRAWVKVQGPGQGTIGVVTHDRSGKVLEWARGARSAREGKGWQHLRSRLVIPPGVVEILPRLIGSGKATVWMQGFTIQGVGNLKDLRRGDLPDELEIRNEAISVKLQTGDLTLSILDRRNGATWRQEPLDRNLVLKNATTGRGLMLDLLHVPSGLDLKASLELDGNRPELLVSLSARGDLPRPIAFPYPFATGPGSYLVVPLNEGISYPVDDPAISPLRLIAYGGHGICMAFWGAVEGERAYMGIFETPDDAALRIHRVKGLLVNTPEWESQKGRFGYDRRLRYVFFHQGGHVDMCKRYLKTLEEKRRENPDVDLLVGAVNVWCWDRRPLEIVRELRAAGIERILWSHRGRPETIRAMNEMGILTGRYDIYQDVMNPENFQYLRGVHSDWPTEAWPDDLMVDGDGNWIRGWRVRGKDGKMRPCGVLCDRQAPAYARKRIPPELETHPYRARFIDTTTASPWRECYSSDHPLTRGQSRHWKMELLRVISGELGLVTGSETGHDAAVPHVHYFEGMLSLGPYRVPDAGRDMQRMWDEIPERVNTFQLGHRYRLPLWELVYHDCVVAQWYWGDYNNKLPALWDRRDLFNVLYGTPPMFMFNRDIWARYRDRFARSYRATCPVARAVGYSEMRDHRFLGPDRSVQQTVFSNGVTVTVNFGDTPYRLGTGRILAPGAQDVAGLKGN